MPDLDLPRHAGATALACGYLEARLGTAGWGRSDVSRVVLAVGEAVSNAVEHGPSLDEPIHLEAHVDSEQATLTIRDGGHGPALQRLQSARLPRDPFATEGRGLYILSQLADEIYRSEPDALVLSFRPRS